MFDARIHPIRPRRTARQPATFALFFLLAVSEALPAVQRTGDPSTVPQGVRAGEPQPKTEQAEEPKSQRDAVARNETEETPSSATQEILRAWRQPSADPTVAARAEGLIAQLDSPRVPERVDATRELIRIGQPALHAIRAGLATAASDEARDRLQRALHCIFFDRHLQGRNGYLGVGLAPAEVTVPVEDGGDATHLGIRITHVEPGAPADTGGMHRGDLVFRIDGHSMEEILSAPSVVDSVVNYVLARGPDARIELSVLRESQSPPLMLDLSIVIGRRPHHRFFSDHRFGDTRARLLRAQAEFEWFWETHAPATSPPK